MSGVVGAILLLLSALMIGTSMQRAEFARIDLLRGTVLLLSHARRQIALFGTPVDRIFFDFADGFDPSILQMLSELPVEQSLPILADRLKPYGSFLLKFADEIGSGYREDALHLCDYCIDTAKAELVTAEEAYSRRKKLYITLPLLFAVSLIVLFI
ncbi:MAG: hypothetical protein IJZ08_02490 [Clostridia bacterium]|nr:hypothetical protein [Clostridia bacterium]